MARPDFDAVNAAALAALRSLLAEWFPHGKPRGREYVVGDLDGTPGESLSINLDTGRWADFASDARGGDPISLYAAMRHLGQADAARELAEALGVAPLPPVRPQRQATARRNGRPASGRRVTRHEIRDPAGELRAVHVREDRPEGKRFWWEQPDGSRGLGGVKAADLPLYGIDALRDAPDGAAVVVVEGEKAREALRAAGVRAVGTVTGASGTPADDALRPLLRFRLALWPDADDVGVAHMRRTDASLARLGHRDVRWIAPGDAREHDDAHDFFARGGTREQLRALVRGEPPDAGPAPRQPAGAAEPQGREPGDETEAEVEAGDARRLVAGGRAQALADADEVLGQQDNVFQRNGRLVLAAWVRDAKAQPQSMVKRDPDSLMLHPMTPDHVMNVLARQRWCRFDGRSHEWRPADFPREYARGVVADAEWPHVRPLTSIIGAPTLDENLAVIDTPGYHAGTGLLLVTPITFARVPETPTRDQALAALALLRAPFAEFPWVRREGDPPGATAAESVHLAAILTAGIRHLLDTAPAVGYDAPRRGSGKSLLGDAVGTIWHGTPPAHATYAKAEDEFRKMIAACLVAGDPCIMVDNVDRPFRSPELSNALTTTRYADRKLGYTERYVLDARVLWLVNGNNLTVVGDLARRVLLCRIDPEEERPEARSFRIPHLLQHVRQHRATLAPAALMIVKAFALADPPRQAATPFGSFERWSRLVREALIWLDLPDPCGTMDDVNDTEPEAQALAGLLSAWREEYGATPRTAPEVVADATARGREWGAETPAHTALHEAVSAALGGPKAVNARALGYYLRRWQHVIVAGLRLRPAGRGHGNTTSWRLDQRGDDGTWR